MTVFSTEGRLHKDKIAEGEMDNKSGHMCIMKINSKMNKLIEISVEIKCFTIQI